MIGEADPPEWPLDPPGLVFLARAVKAVGSETVLKAIANGKVIVGVRLVETMDGRVFQLPANFLTPEGWAEALETFQIDMRDQRPGVARRRMPKPHWLFATKKSLDALILPSPSPVGDEARETPVDSVAPAEVSADHLRLLAAKPNGCGEKIKSGARPTVPQEVARFLGSQFPTRPSLKSKELLELIKTHAGDIGEVSQSSLTRALKIAWSNDETRQS